MQNARLLLAILDLSFSKGERYYVQVLGHLGDVVKGKGYFSKVRVAVRWETSGTLLRYPSRLFPSPSLFPHGGEDTGYFFVNLYVAGSNPVGVSGHCSSAVEQQNESPVSSVPHGGSLWRGGEGVSYFNSNHENADAVCSPCLLVPGGVGFGYFCWTETAFGWLRVQIPQEP